MGKPTWMRTVETTELITRLQEVPVGGVISYGELSEAIGKNVCKEACGYLQSARRILMAEQHIMFEPVRGTGLRRCDAQGKTRAVDKKMKGAHRAAVRGLKTLDHITEVERTELTPEQRLRLDASGIILHMISRTTSPSIINKMSDGQEVLSRLKLPKVS